VNISGGDLDCRPVAGCGGQINLAEAVITPGGDGTVILQCEAVEISGGDLSEGILATGWDAIEVQSIIEVTPGNDSMDDLNGGAGPGVTLGEDQH
jgi:hypothetical protein